MSSIMLKAKAFAPATVANVAVGFDILGFALEGLGETATVERLDSSREVIVEEVPGFPEIPLDPLKNTATAGLVRLVKERSLPFGFRVHLNKTIPVGSGLGGSSTSAVAAMFAANYLLKKKLSTEEILEYALTGEEVASGSRHADNIGPCLKGGLILVRSKPTLELINIKTPQNLRCVIILPDLSIQTSQARKLLSQEVSLASMIEQTVNLSGFLLGCLQSDFKLMQKSLRDVVIEPQRAKLIPGFYELQQTAMRAGALGFSLSGSGPAMFALTAGPTLGKKVQQRLIAKAKALGLPLKGSWLSRINKKGARLVR